VNKIADYSGLVTMQMLCGHMKIIHMIKMCMKYIMLLDTFDP